MLLTRCRVRVSERERESERAGSEREKAQILGNVSEADMADVFQARFHKHNSNPEGENLVQEALGKFSLSRGD